jgi:hypothetical protein
MKLNKEISIRHNLIGTLTIQIFDESEARIKIGRNITFSFYSYQEEKIFNAFSNLIDTLK